VTTGWEWGLPGLGFERGPVTFDAECSVAATIQGRLEAAACAIAAERSQFMLCGNPDMVKDVTATLVERGLRKHRRRAPGHITVENFW